MHRLCVGSPHWSQITGIKTCALAGPGGAGGALGFGNKRISAAGEECGRGGDPGVGKTYLRHKCLAGVVETSGYG